MTASNFAPEHATTPSTKLRVASTLAWLVGLLTIAVLTALAIPAVARGVPVWPYLVNGALGAVLCLGGYYLRRRRRAGLYLVFAAWLVIAVTRLFLPSAGGVGFFLALVALALALSSRKELA